MPTFHFYRAGVTCEECGEDKPRDGATHCSCGASRFSVESNACEVECTVRRDDSTLTATVDGHSVLAALTAEERRDALKLITESARFLS